MSASIVFTGGGTAGHVTPNLALIDELKEEGWQIAYMGSGDGIEKQIMDGLSVPFYPVSSGKLRRYMSLRNFLDPFKIIFGIFQAAFLFFRHKPQVVFSKGGFVAFPVVVGAWLNRIPIIAHESDLSPGLANRLCFPFVTRICLTFDATKKHFKKQEKITVTGTPIRRSLFEGRPEEGLKLCGFTKDKPCLLMMGGSMGSGSMNLALRQALDTLIKEFQVIHLCGKGKIDPALQGTKGYCQLEYANEELAHLFAASDVVISRSGANSLYELLALGKAHILVPLSAKVSRGDQIQNAAYFEKLGISKVINDEDLNDKNLVQAVHEVMHNKNEREQKIKALNVVSAAEKIVSIIKEEAHVKS
jgi:UDP-N-acetylglucosamine--N-acetylmuramyl-(pentapeptide) pyrophosphoryl-undecaprenol N-acetylglucosamine transferase